MKLVKTIARVAIIVFVSLVLGLNVYNWNAKSLMGNALPMPMGYGAAVTLTGSMEPTIGEDDLIIVKAQDSYELQDIVVYQSGSIVVVHRVIAMDGDTIITQGDANQAADEAINVADIKGKVIAIVPLLGSMARVLKTPTATIALLIGAVLLLEMSFRKEKQKSSDELELIKEEIRKLKEEQESAE